MVRWAAEQLTGLTIKCLQGLRVTGATDPALEQLSIRQAPARSPVQVLLGYQMSTRSNKHMYVDLVFLRDARSMAEPSY